MNDWQFVIITVVMAFATALTRFLPFVIFDRKKNTPEFVEYLGSVLPAAMMGLLVVYCFKDYDFLNIKEILPAVISAAAVAGLHIWKRNTILSIAAGTCLYMVLIRLIELI